MNNKNYQLILEYWTRKRIPYIFDETLSLYELVRKTIKALNEMIKDQNELKDAIVEFIGLFDENIKETITDILQDWETSGKLEDVINQALFNGIGEIDEKLNDLVYSVKGKNTDEIQEIINTHHLTKNIYFPKNLFCKNH